MINDFDGSRPLTMGAGVPASRQVNWFSTYEFVQRYAADHDVVHDHRLIAGSPQWCGMADDDARKLMALVMRGVQAALADDAHQAEMAESSREIARTTDCTALAQRVRSGRGPHYIPRRSA